MAPGQRTATHAWHWRELFGLVTLGLALLALWRVPYIGALVYPLRLFATFVHELGHGLTALATGGEFQHFVVNADLSGTAWSAGGTRWMVISAGYLGCALTGCSLLALAARGASGRGVLGTLGVLLVAACLLFVRNAFGLATGIGIGLALVLAAWRLPPLWRDGLLSVLAVQLVLDGFNSLFDLVTLAGDAAIHTDARTMGELTGLPATWWALAWSALSLVLLALTLRFAYRRRTAAP
ncbi:M50 family metallopeptidase [Dokdonella sp.]|uniref:M50 family metallopeptidase n=1 Tax=Dokdonella sp. TaxID=2291710 RepID=UPI0025B7E906|nr:M50 family metallopeptidase [Dokdonella sp.]MBX3692177.1 M50 family metallopeptidase [Dokdonella sp.]